MIMWEHVGIFFNGDRFPVNLKDKLDGDRTQPGYFYIIWYAPKKPDGPHPFLLKETPLTIEAIDAVIKRQREKLRTESSGL